MSRPEMCIRTNNYSSYAETFFEVMRNQNKYPRTQSNH